MRLAGGTASNRAKKKGSAVMDGDVAGRRMSHALASEAAMAKVKPRTLPYDFQTRENVHVTRGYRLAKAELRTSGAYSWSMTLRLNWCLQFG
jgi:hypothetical protein